MATNGTVASGTEKYDHQNGVGLNDPQTVRRPYDYGGNPLAHTATNDPTMVNVAFGGAARPGLYAPPRKGIANPAPLGLSAFALTTFVLSLINVRTRGVNEPNLVIAAAYGYGGIVQLLAGMWEMVVGNTFGATALSSYGGFWLSFAIVLTPSTNIVTSLGGGTSGMFLNSFGFFLMGWWIFTFLLMTLTLRSTLMFFLLFFWLQFAFLLLGIGYLHHDNGVPNVGCIRAGGVFGLLAAFWAWYNAFAGIADSTNSFFVVPVVHFPWSEKGRERRNRVDNSAARADQAV